MPRLDQIFETESGREAVKELAEINRKNKRGDLSAHQAGSQVAELAEEAPEIREKIFLVAENFDYESTQEEIIEQVTELSASDDEDAEFDEEDAKAVKEEMESEDFQEKMEVAQDILKKKATPGRSISEKDQEKLEEIIDSLPPMMKKMVGGTLEEMEDE